MIKSAFSKVTNYVIKKRTFEGKTNPSKNNHALTSKYMPSYKYIAIFDLIHFDGDENITGGTRKTNKCYRTKKEAATDMQEKVNGYKIW